MELIAYQKLAKNIFRLLKINEIIFPIGRTPKGNLSLRFADNLEGFEMMLDSIPLTISDPLKDDNNIELKRMIEKYWFEGQSGLEKQMVKTAIQDNPFLSEIVVTEGLEVSEGDDFQEGIEALEEGMKAIKEEIKAKKKGRPIGSKNKVKDVKDTHKETTGVRE